MIWPSASVPLVRQARLARPAPVARLARLVRLVWFARLVRLVWFARLVRLVWFARLVRLVWFARLVRLVWFARPEGHYRSAASVQEVEFDGFIDAGAGLAEPMSGSGDPQVVLFLEFDHDHRMALILVVDPFGRGSGMQVHEQMDRAPAAHRCVDNLEGPTAGAHRSRRLVVSAAVCAAVDQQLTGEPAAELGCVVTVDAMPGEQLEQFGVTQVGLGLDGIGHGVTLCADERQPHTPGDCCTR